MHKQIEALFEDAESRYLMPEELNVLSQYVHSVPSRLDVYRTLRDHEIQIMQPIADQLQREFPQVPVDKLERSIKNGLLALRYCAMAMLLNDESFLQDRVRGWLDQTSKVYDTHAIDTSLYRQLSQQLDQHLPPQQAALIQPLIKVVQDLLAQS